eukprot:1653711-Prymnesium_polylepis.1
MHCMPTLRNERRRPFLGDTFCRSAASAALSNAPVGMTKESRTDAPVTFPAKMSSGSGSYQT